MPYYSDERGCLERAIELLIGGTLILLCLVLFLRWMLGLHGYWFS